MTSFVKLEVGLHNASQRHQNQNAAEAKLQAHLYLSSLCGSRNAKIEVDSTWPTESPLSVCS